MRLAMDGMQPHQRCIRETVTGDYLLCMISAGRATVELTIEKQDGSQAYVTNEGGGPQKEVRLHLMHCATCMMQ